MYTQFKYRHVGECFDSDGNQDIRPYNNDDPKLIRDYWTIYGVVAEGLERALIDFIGEGITMEHTNFFNSLLKKSQPDPNTINLEWHIDDVIFQARERDINLNKDEAREILESIKNAHDATVGVNWDVLDIHIDNFIITNKGART